MYTQYLCRPCISLYLTHGDYDAFSRNTRCANIYKDGFRRDSHIIIITIYNTAI